MITKFLEDSIDQYDFIILITETDLLSEFFESKAALVTNKKILVLSSEHPSVKNKNIAFQIITNEDSEQLVRLYYMYGFSDNFLLVSKENISYASIYNFVDAGLLMKEDIFNALIE